MRAALALLAAALLAPPAFAQQPAPRELVELAEKLPAPPGIKRSPEHARSGLPRLYRLGAEALRDDPALRTKAKAIFDLYLADAQAGDNVARASVARMYWRGAAVAKNDAIAFDWMRLAAEAGDADAEAGLAYFYYNGEGTPKNRAEALRWARAAAEGGQAFAYTLYGVAHMHPVQPDRPDYALAFEWLTKAAAMGEPYAEMNLSDMYRMGVGRPKDAAAALEHMRRALEIFRDAGSTSAVSEDVRRYMVQAQAAIRDKQFAEARTLLAQARNYQPWMPMAWYNLGLVQAELGVFDDAIWNMRVFLMLAPDAPQARGAQDLIYEWERKLPK